MVKVLDKLKWECEMSEKDIKDYKVAFERFEERFLIEGKSIFRLEDNDEILNDDSIKYLNENFITNGYIGNGNKKENTTSIEKFYHQLTGADTGNIPKQLTDIQKNAIEVLATAVWLWRLPSINSNSTRRKASAKEITDFKGEIFCEGHYKGFAMTGQGYNTNKANELAYIINMFNQYLTKNTNIIKWLEDNRNVEITTKKTYIKQVDKYMITDLTPKTNKEKVFVPNPLLHLINPADYEPIISNDHKKKILNVFSKIFELTFEDKSIDKKIKEIKQKLQNKIKDSDFYDENIKNIWLGGIDFESKNIILHGAPGTGKTYLTEETIKARKLIEDNSEYELVQFHLQKSDTSGKLAG
jgi:hypothetical protein